MNEGIGSLRDVIVGRIDQDAVAVLLQVEDAGNGDRLTGCQRFERSGGIDGLMFRPSTASATASAARASSASFERTILSWLSWLCLVVEWALLGRQRGSVRTGLRIWRSCVWASPSTAALTRIAVFEIHRNSNSSLPGSCLWDVRARRSEASQRTAGLPSGVARTWTCVSMGDA